MDEEPKIETGAEAEQDAPETEPVAEETTLSPIVADGTDATEVEAVDTPDGTSTTTTATVSGPMTSERVIDIAFGVAVLTGEAIDRAAQRLVERTKSIQDQTPAFLAEAEERGRPIRQNLLGNWSEPPIGPSPAPSGVGFADPVIDTPQDGDSGEGAGNGIVGDTETEPVTATASTASPAAPSSPSLGSGIAGSLRNLGNSLGLLGGGRQSAEDEIRSLESRVRELEQTVASAATGTESTEDTPAAPTAYDLGELLETPADSATYVPGTHPAEDTLSDSPYAVSETSEEQASEAAAETTEQSPTPSPSRSRKKPRESDVESIDGGEGDTV